MPSCAAINCKNRSEKGFRLFRLPTDEHRKKNWLVNMGLETWMSSKNIRLCEAHFEGSQWEQNRADGWMKLKPNAIPTIFDSSILFPITVIKTDIFKLCRICLRVHDDLINLFKPVLNNQIPFLELMEHTSLQVSPDDNLPPYICKECFEMLQAIKTFKEKCIQSENLLKNYNGPNTLENLIEYIASKPLAEGIWYIDNEDNLETLTEDKKNFQDKTENLNDFKDRLNKLDEFLDKQLEILKEPIKKNEPIKKIEQSKQSEFCQKLPFHKKQIHPKKLPITHFPSNNPNSQQVIKDVVNLPKLSFFSKYELQDFVCHLCGKTVKYLDSHMKTHNSSFEHKCEICGKQFRQSVLLRKHLIVHNGEKNFECGVCHMAFTRAQVRNRHIKTVHGKIRQFKCSICPKSFHLAYRLKVHMITHTGERRYKCDVEGCTAQYTQRTPLNNHKLKYHSNNRTKTKNFQCTICDKVFKEKRYLVAHISLHDMNKSFQCSICLRKFKKQINLQEHICKHTSGRSSKCNKCSKSFLSDRMLKRHMKMHISVVEAVKTIKE